MVIIIIGLPGSGKSYFAERLAKIIQANYINSDRLRKEFFPQSTYSQEEKATVYMMMLEKMKEAIINERNIVLDASFHKKSRRVLFTKNAGEKILFIEVWADESIIKERVKKKRTYSEADYKIHHLIKQEWEPLNEDHLRLKSTNDNIDEMLQKAMKYLKNDKRTNP